MDRDALKQATGSTAAFVWFALLFLLALVVATVTLSASQLQSRLLSLANSDTPLSVWQIERIRSEWVLQKAEIGELRSKSRSASERLAEIRRTLAEIEIRITVLESDVSRFDDSLQRKLKLFDPLRVEAAALENLTTRSLLYEGIISDLEGKLNDETWEQITEDNRSLAEALAQKRQVERGLQIYQGQFRDAETEAKSSDESLRVAERRLEAIIDPDTSLDKAAKGRVYDLVSEFEFIQNFALGTLHKFSTLPGDFLIIILVMTMGVLGSTMQLTYDYYKAGTIVSVSPFILRPMLGAITALVVFILLKAGVLVVTDSAKLGGVAPLNPFFIAFVGIVSGLLSENALEMIRSVGTSWLNTSGDNGNDRWAIGMKPLMVDTKSAVNLAKRTGIAEELITKWAEQEAPVPATQQGLIAAWLDTDRRALFTDIPPAPVTT